MKKIWALLLGAVMVASIFTAAPVGAQEAPEAPVVPDEPLIVDPSGDANYINDGWGLGVVPLPNFKDNDTPADASTVGDLLAVWMTDDADNVYAHFQTEAPGPGSAAFLYRLRVDPGVGATCMWFQGRAPGGGNADAEPIGNLRTVAPCDPAETVGEGAEFIQTTAEDGTGIHTVKIPRALNPALVDGATLATPWVDVTNILVAATAPTIDNTEVGIDYVIGSGGGSGEGDGSGEGEGDGEVDGDEPKEPKKEKCKKYKKKKKRKACKKRNKKAQEGSQDPGSPEDPETPEAPSGDVCPAYEPGESGAAAETTVVTDEATAEAPLEIIVPTEAGLPEIGITEAFQNIQVDTANENAGLYVRIEFFDDEDLDLYLRYPDDSVAAQAAGFNPVSFIPTNPVFNTNGQGRGGHSEMGAEQVDGVLTPDCGGYTARFDEYYGFGGDRTVKLWLGDATWDPEAQAPIE